MMKVGTMCNDSDGWSSLKNEQKEMNQKTKFYRVHLFLCTLDNFYTIKKLIYQFSNFSVTISTNIQ